jgi:hypothetical protein
MFSMTRHVQAMRSRHGRHAVVAALLLVGLVAIPYRASAEPADPDALIERPDDPPDLTTSMTNETSAAATIGFGRFTSVQVNVSATGANVLHDAANEPSIAIDPNDPNRIVIGWRQFDSRNSNFRQAGYGYSTNGGLTWTTGKIDPGVFRSDPVLGFDTQGRFYYNSLTSNLACSVFQSTNGGATWGAGVPAFGGDKQWMTIDRTSGPGHGQLYESWSTESNPSPPNTFSRSIDQGQSFQSPSFVPSSPIWGTLDVAPDGTLYMVGTTGPDGPIYVSRSSDAQNSGVTPSFTTTTVDLGGTIQTGGPNPAGLLGQLWIAVDRSSGPRSGWVYVLASVKTPTDPLDVMFIRSTDGGQTWSVPVRVNDDAPGTRAFQWFGTMSVAPNGRIDAVWNDTRGSADSTISALYYAYSLDGGATWSANEQASPVWNSTVGWPKQNKIGDYYQMISRDAAADLAWAATFNGEQDVYHLRIAAPTVAVAEAPPAPARLLGVAPNPFSSSTSIGYETAAREPVTLEVFDAAGRRVATLVDGTVDAGRQTARWSGADPTGQEVKPGLYLARLRAGGTIATVKLMMLR